MAQGSTTFHESEDHLTAETRDLHRAIVSLMEELEAIDWYQQRVDAAHDAGLREILRHNRDEEMEHVALLLEWIRRRCPDFDVRLRPRLFTEGQIIEHEEALEGNGAASGNGVSASASLAAPSVTIGSLREDR
jgi:hypothetical protein